MKNIQLDSTDLTWLASLARALLREVHAADDLVQDTLVAALEGPIPANAPRRPWLGAVARKLAARHFRTEARRGQRELRVAQPEALPDSAELLERAEVAEHLTAAARRLPEPFRRTVLLRFLEGISVEEIASREHKPADTVRWRVRRGLDLLREDLVQSHNREWSSWSVLLLPLARSGGGIGLVTIGASGAFVGTVASLTAMKTILVGLALCGLGWWTFGTPGDSSEDGSSANAAVVSESDSMQSEPGSSEVPREGKVQTPVGERVLVSGPTSAVVESVALNLSGSVLDENGQPVASAIVYLLASAVDSNAPERPSKGALLQVSSDKEGRFLISQEDLLSIEQHRERGLDLGVSANGFLREFVPGVLSSSLRGGEHNVTLSRGGTLRGRVVDEFGGGVANLNLLAYPRGAGIDHVSPSQSLLRAERAWLGAASSNYQQCRARTDARGEVEFTGLPEGELMVRSLDLAWSIQEPSKVRAGGDYTLWTAGRCLGVRLSVFEERTGQSVAKASATFRSELTFANGEVQDFGQWVGRGQGEASFVLAPELLPGLEDRTVVGALFYGTVRSGMSEVPWRAEPLEDALGVSGVAQVRVDIDSLAFSVSDLVGETPEQNIQVASLALDVRYEDGSAFEGPLSLSWTSMQVDGSSLKGDDRLIPRGSGRFETELPAGDVTLQVTDYFAAGSLPPWTGQVLCQASQTHLAIVTLPRGARVEIGRPEGWRGEWFVHASWREPGAKEWQGSWGYSTDEKRLELSALRPAEWRFQLRKDSALEADPLVRTALLSKGAVVELND